MIVDELLTILEGFKVPVYRQGSRANSDVYEDTFITYWNNDAPDHAHYNNASYGTAWSFSVFVYSIDPDVIYSLILEIRKALKNAGFVVKGKGYDVQSDEPSHTGRAIECEYLEVTEEEPEPEPEPDQEPEPEPEPGTD